MTELTSASKCYASCTACKLCYLCVFEVLNSLTRLRCQCSSKRRICVCVGRAKEAGITVVNEVGVDPGIDHMLAMQCFDDVKIRGGKVMLIHHSDHTSHRTHFITLCRPTYALRVNTNAVILAIILNCSSGSVIDFLAATAAAAASSSLARSSKR